MRLGAIRYLRTMASSRTSIKAVVCEGCGLSSDPAHIAQRFARLEQTTRFRPIHIQAVFLSAQSPTNLESFLYGATSAFSGEALELLQALQIETMGKPAEAVLAEFQRKGFLLTHVLECAREEGTSSVSAADALKSRLPIVLRRLRTSLKPKKIMPIPMDLMGILPELKSVNIGGELVLDEKAPFDLRDSQSVGRLRSML